MKSMLVLTCLCSLGVSRDYGISQKVLDFTSYYNGEFDNEAQTQEAGDNHPLIQASFIPVNLECFLPRQSFYMEQSMDFVTKFFGVGVVTDSIGDTVSLTIYTIANYTKPPEFDMQKLFHVPCRDFQFDPGCIGSFRVATSEGFVFGNVPYCSQPVNGTYRRFASVHTCKTATLTMPTPIQPYELVLKSPKYLLVTPPSGYVVPCGN